VNQPSGTVASVVESGAPRFPCGAALAVADPEARCRNVVSAARAAVAFVEASDEMWDRSGAHAVADRAVVRDSGSAIGRNDDLVPAAGKAVAHRIVARADNYATAPDNSFAPGADNFAVVASHNSVAIAIGNYAVQNSCVPAAADIGAGLVAGWVPGVVNGWAPDVKDGDRCDGFAQDTAPLPMPAS